MPVQDLTPQLRTRLSQVERAVGWFVILATLLLLAAFAYYVYSTAEHKGWFKIKLPYHTFVSSGAGLHEGDPVKLMGFDVGQITKIEAMPPFSGAGNVYIQFIIQEPYYGYVWTDSYVKLVSAGFLGSRTLEVVQGGTSGSTNLHPSYDVDIKTRRVMGVWSHHGNKMVPFTSKSKGYSFSNAVEAPIVTDQLELIAEQAKNALPGILDLTNQVGRVLSNVVQLTARADGVILQAQPLVTNLTAISSLLTNGQGALGDWLIPTNLNHELQQTLTSAHATLGTANDTLNTANTNVAKLAESLDMTLINLANITSNLNAQVQTNDQILSQISTVIIHADQMVQGLKHHWLLRSAFKNEKQPSPATLEGPGPLRSAPVEPKKGKR